MRHAHLGAKAASLRRAVKSAKAIEQARTAPVQSGISTMARVSTASNVQKDARSAVLQAVCARNVWEIEFSQKAPNYASVQQENMTTRDSRTANPVLTSARRARAAQTTARRAEATAD